MNTKSYSIVRKNSDELSREWDKIAKIRNAEIISGKDTSYSKVLSRELLKLSLNKNSVLDVGCGTGNLSMLIKTSFDRTDITGIDPSIKSVKIAKKNYPDINFISTSVENFANKSDKKFDFIISNMVLMDALNIQEFTNAIYKLSSTKNTAHTLTHPAFWPQYWGYDSLPSFNYMKEIQIETNFKTRGRIYPYRTTHIHRPLEKYFNSFIQSGFKNIKITELRGPESVREFKFPRFILLETLE